MALATGQLNPQNIDGFMRNLQLLGESDVQRFRDRVSPQHKSPLIQVEEEIIEIEEEQITIVVKEDAEEQVPEKPHVVIFTDSQADNQGEEEPQAEQTNPEDAQEDPTADAEVVEVIPVVIEVDQPENQDVTDAPEEDGPIITVVEQPEQTGDDGQENIQGDD